LSSVRLAVTGTQFEHRFNLIRVLEPGTQVSLSYAKDNPHDPEAILVIHKGKQLGWIPREANTAIRGLKKQFAKVSRTGTDRTGRWTFLEIEITFKIDSPAAKVIAEYGPVVATVLHLMMPKDVEQAKRIALLSKEEQKLAIDEWNMTQQEGASRRRRRT